MKTKKVLIAGVVLWGVISPAAALSLDELLAKDIQCDKPFDMVTPHGKAVAELCIRAKATGMDPANLVELELATSSSVMDTWARIHNGWSITDRVSKKF